MNGNVNKALVGAMIALLVAAVAGAWTMAQRMSSVEATINVWMSETGKRIDRLDARVGHVERREVERRER